MHGDELALTPGAFDLFARREGGSVYDRLDRLQADLKQIPVPSAATGQQLSPGAYHRAVAAYKDWAEEWFEQQGLASPAVDEFEPEEMLRYAAEALQAYIKLAFEGDEPDIVRAVACLESTLRCNPRGLRAIRRTSWQQLVDKKVATGPQQSQARSHAPV